MTYSRILLPLLAPIFAASLAARQIPAAGSPATSPLELPPPQQVLRLVAVYPHPVITLNSPGAENDKYGFEGGRAIKVSGTYHLFTTEMDGEPRFVKTRIAYWTSSDRIHWKRISTLFESTAEMTGTDVHASLWAPMPVYNLAEGRWNLFYVGYRAEPEGSPYPPKLAPADTNPYLEHPDPEHLGKHIFYNSSGVILRAVSRVKGLQGIGGPYDEAGIVLKPGPDSQPWEGIQGTDSFFPYRAGGKWYGFYGSCHCESLPVKGWQVGLASSPTLAGPWTRVEGLNPILLDRHFIENPIVTRVQDGTYVAVYNGPQPDAVGYATSSNGIRWNRGLNLIVQPRDGAHWASTVRTPLGLIPEGHGTYTLFFSGFQKTSRGGPFNGEFKSAIGFVTLRYTPAGRIAPARR